jgi:hypothetical protein
MSLEVNPLSRLGILKICSLSRFEPSFSRVRITTYTVDPTKSTAKIRCWTSCNTTDGFGMRAHAARRIPLSKAVPNPLPKAVPIPLSKAVPIPLPNALPLSALQSRAHSTFQSLAHSALRYPRCWGWYELQHSALSAQFIAMETALLTWMLTVSLQLLTGSFPGLRIPFAQS